MTPTTLQVLGAYPFLDGIELSALSGMPQRSAFRQLKRLGESGHSASLLHATPHIPRTRRHYLTDRGVRRLALELGVEPDDAILSHPLTAQWQRILVRRLDAVAVIYRLASSLARLAPTRASRPNLRWYRRGAWDAAVLMDGSAIAILRMGQTADRSAFGRRLWSLERMRRPEAALIISHDEPEQRNLALKLRGRPIAAFIATERDVGLDAPNLSVWRVPGLAGSLSLAQIVGTMGRGGTAPPSSPTRLNHPPRPAPQLESPLSLVPRSAKSALAALSDWPLIRQEHLAKLLGVRRRQLYSIRQRLLRDGLVVALQLPNAEGRRLALSDTGIRALAYRDRSDVTTTLRRWSATPAGKRVVRGRKLRQLARVIEHTDAVHDFLARLVAETRATRGAALVAITPPHRAARYFQFEGRTRAILPDAAGEVKLGRERLPFILEWERRAKHPSKAADRLGPYLRYFSGGSPADDYGSVPVILVAFDDVGAETQFLLHAGDALRASRVHVPFLTTHAGALLETGALGQSWRSPRDPALRRMTLRDGGREGRETAGVNAP